MKKKAKIISACAAAVIAAGGGIAAYILSRGGDEPEPEVIPEVITEAPTELPTEPATLPVVDYNPEPVGMTGLGKALLHMNPDMNGWLTIHGTDVDYPFVRDPGEIKAADTYYGGQDYPYNEYYLSHDIDRSYKRSGTLFSDWRCNLEAPEGSQSENLVIYGHNMANNTMFGSLRRYRQDYSYWDTHAFVDLDTLYTHYDYVIFAVIITGGNWYSDFVYWDMEELDSQEEFDYYIDSVYEKQLFSTGIDVEYGDKLMTLSTCYSDEDNSRFLVIARRLREGEVGGDLSTIKGSSAYRAAHPEEYTEPPTPDTDTTDNTDEEE
ncbi:MAG: class B sortase [Ruminococcus sp.]|nr:class B sortase [Ruminococcus sp.]